MKRKILTAGIAAGVLALLAVLLLTGVLWPNRLFAARFAVRGIDVSAHQVEIDWDRVAQNADISFVYMKATEGMDFVDKSFARNWQDAAEAGKPRGAYHYFRVTSTGAAQARNFCSAVPVEVGTLPPVIDIEQGGLSREEFLKQLGDFIAEMEKQYGQAPVLYVVYPLYEQYLKGEFTRCPIWIRDVVKPPALSDERQWLFWQYSDRESVPGIRGPVDGDVFSGSLNDLQALLRQ